MNMDESNFIVRTMYRDVKVSGIGAITTRFPPEPNAPLHIGHTKSLLLNSHVWGEHSGDWVLRFDDTNPLSGKQKYVGSIIKTIKWFGLDHFPIRFASDYYHTFYSLASGLLMAGRAYVDSQSFADFKLNKGTFRLEGRSSADRNRSVKDGVKLWRQMKFGRYALRSKVLRAKINLGSSNLTLRDPVLCRLCFASHYRTKHKWHVHPTYDYAHAISDCLEGITHSLCTLEFEQNRELYNWVLDNVVGEKVVTKTSWPKQIEFARLNIGGMVTSKRFLVKLIKLKLVKRLDDLRLNTIVGIRRSGLMSGCLKDFIAGLGVSKSTASVKREELYGPARKTLDRCSPKRTVTISPLRVIVENVLAAARSLNPIASSSSHFFSGRRKVVLTDRLDVESTRLNPAAEAERRCTGTLLRLKNGLMLKCLGVVRSGDGELLVRTMLFSTSEQKKADQYVREDFWTNASTSSKIVINAKIGKMVSGRNTVCQLELLSNDWLSRGQALRLEPFGCFMKDYASRPGFISKFNLTAAA